MHKNFEKSLLQGNSTQFSIEIMFFFSSQANKHHHWFHLQSQHLLKRSLVKYKFFTGQGLFNSLFATHLSLTKINSAYSFQDDNTKCLTISSISVKHPIAPFPLSKNEVLPLYLKSYAPAGKKRTCGPILPSIRIGLPP